MLNALSLRFYLAASLFWVVAPTASAPFAVNTATHLTAYLPARWPTELLTHLPQRRTPVIVWQPSHQTDTGVDFNEAMVSNSIVEAAMKLQPQSRESKVWSLGVDTVHHSNVGSNTVIAHTTAVVGARVSGYAYEIALANSRHPDVFIAVHNNGSTNRHAVWGYVHEGDKNEPANRVLAARLTNAIAQATDLENRGVFLDSSTGRNDYRCSSSGKLAFFSLDENANTAPFRVLLEIGDNAVSRDFLQNPVKQKLVGEAIKKALIAWIADTWKE